MKGRVLLFATVAVGVGTLATTQVLSQDQPTAPGGEMPDMEEMMRKWMAVAAPSDHHKHLEHFVGTWKTTTRLWMGGPGTSPTETTGSATVKWILGGRFILEEHQGEIQLPASDGQMRKVPFQGVGLTGYDNFKNMYIGTWADNMNTHLLSMSGTRDPSGKFTFYCEMAEPMLDVHGRMVKYVTRVISKDKHIFESYDLHAGDDYKVLEITYERQ
jgi:hypothetical protein